MNSGALDDAIRTMLDVSQQYSGTAKYWEILSILYGVAGNSIECKNSCLNAIKLNPNNATSFTNLGASHNNLGEYDLAETAFKKALSINNNLPKTHNNIGALYILKGEFKSALQYITKAIELQPDYSDAYTNLAEIQKSNQQPEEATLNYKKAITLNAHAINAYVGLGSLYSFSGRFNEALETLHIAESLNPAHIECLFNIGFVHYLKKDTAKASNYFSKTLEIYPEHCNARYLLSAITGEDSPEKSPENYVIDLFDNYADTFDEHLVTNLGYNVPDTMFEMCQENIKPATDLKLLDLGCGTGLCGEKLFDQYPKMTGIDLSNKMIEKARNKNLYDELIISDIEQFISNTKQNYDLVLAADVFIYIGNISSIIPKISRLLNTTGYLLFSIELSTEKAGFKLQHTGRYAHSMKYINDIIKPANLNIVSQVESIIRNEKGTEIKGAVILCNKTST